jgi:hypothetical protein
MSVFAGAAARAGRAGRGLVPTGQLLTPEVWAQRHRGIVWLLWLHVGGVVVFALVRGKGLGHALTEVTPIVASALAAGLPTFAGGPGRRRRCSAWSPPRP